MRLKKLFFWLGLGTVTLAAATTIAYSSNKTKIYSHNKPTKKICVSVKGAVAHPNKYFFNEGVKIRDVFKKVRVLPSADITKIDFNEVLTKNRTITVPYKLSDSKDGRIAKIHWTSLHDVSQLTKYGITRKVAEKVIDYRRSHWVVTWRDIESIKGLGKTNLAKLKKIIII